MRPPPASCHGRDISTPAGEVLAGGEREPVETPDLLGELPLDVQDMFYSELDSSSYPRHLSREHRPMDSFASSDLRRNFHPHI